MSLGLEFFYGNYKHPRGEVRPLSITKRALKTPRGRRWASEFYMTVEGQLSSDLTSPPTVAQISDKINELDSAYSLDYKDAGFRLQNGALTGHYLPTNSQYALSGTRVVSKSWLHQSPAEFANTRTYRITFWGQYLDTYSELVDFTESVEYIGTGGPRWEFKNRWTGLPQYHRYSLFTKIRAVQRGYTTGLTQTVGPPPPLWPTYEQTDRRRVGYVTPRDHGKNNSPIFTNYRRNYAYFFELPQADVKTANTRSYF